MGVLHFIIIMVTVPFLKTTAEPLCPNGLTEKENVTAILDYINEKRKELASGTFVSGGTLLPPSGPMTDVQWDCEKEKELIGIDCDTDIKWGQDYDNADHTYIVYYSDEPTVDVLKSQFDDIPKTALMTEDDAVYCCGNSVMYTKYLEMIRPRTTKVACVASLCERVVCSANQPHGEKQMFYNISSLTLSTAVLSTTTTSTVAASTRIETLSTAISSTTTATSTVAVSTVGARIDPMSTSGTAATATAALVTSSGSNQNESSKTTTRCMVKPTTVRCATVPRIRAKRHVKALYTKSTLTANYLRRQSRLKPTLPKKS